MSPTAPTFVTLNDRLNQAHRRIRELQARETELLAQNRTLCAVITELTDDDHARSAADLSSRPLPTSAHGDGGDGGSASAIKSASTPVSASVPRRDHRLPRPRVGPRIRHGHDPRQNEAVPVCLTSTRSGRCSSSSPCCGSSPPSHTGVMTAENGWATPAPSARISEYQRSARHRARR